MYNTIVPAQRASFTRRLRMQGALRVDNAQSDDARRWTARCEALWSALSPRRGMSAPQPDGQIRLGAWRASEINVHPVLAPLCGHLLHEGDVLVTLTWRPGTGVIAVVIAGTAGKRHEEVSL